MNGAKAEEVVFQSGAEELRKAIPVLSGLKYPQSFPEATPVRVIRKAILSCSIYSKELHTRLDATHRRCCAGSIWCPGPFVTKLRPLPLFGLDSYFHFGWLPALFEKGVKYVHVETR